MTTCPVKSSMPADWPASPEWPRLQPGKVHVWLADAKNWDLALLGKCLSPEELQHAARFHQETHRRNSIVSRGLLRLLLGGYMAIDPAAVRIATGRFGKPTVGAGPTAASIHFNVTGSKELCMYAIRSGATVGVDLEYMD